jgi:hypothetical protein
MVATVIEDGFHIRSLALDPIRGKLYWSNWSGDNYSVHQAHMDGSEQKMLVSHRDGDTLYSPQSKWIRIFYFSEQVLSILYNAYVEKECRQYF